MIYKKVKFRKVFPIEAYGINESVEFSIQLEEGDDKKEALTDARKNAIDWFNERNAPKFVENTVHAYVPSTIPDIRIEKPMDEETRKENEELRAKWAAKYKKP